MKRKTKCKCGGFMYSQRNDMAELVWKCANCSDEIPKATRSSAKQKKTDDLINSLI